MASAIWRMRQEDSRFISEDVIVFNFIHSFINAIGFFLKSR